MKGITCSVIVFSTAFYLFLHVKSVYSSVKGSELDLELKPMFLMNSAGQVDGGNLELKEFYDKYNAICSSAVKKYDNLLKTVNVYIQRYVNLFLIISGHLNEERNESDDLITVNLEITMSPEDLAYLQSISKASDSASALRDLSRLESILSKVVAKKRSFFLDIWRFLVFIFSFMYRTIYYFLFQSSLHHFTPLLTIVLVVWLMHTFLPRKSFYVYLGIFINSFIFWESLTLYRRKLKEAAMLHETLELNRILNECQAQNVRWYHRLTTIFTGDSCVEYETKYKKVLSNEVSLFKCILETYASYVIQTPMKILGASIRDFTGEISALWPSPLRWLIHIPLVQFTTVSVFLFILILCGKRLRLSFFGAAVEVGDASVVRETKVINVARPRLMSYRSLNILRKSKLLKQIRLNAAKDKKPILAPSDSQCASESEKKDVEEPPALECSETGKKEN